MGNMTEKLPAAYRWLKAYIRFMVEKIYYRRVYYIGKENVPSAGTPLLIASDHQNSLNDALGILLSIRDRIVHFIVRADVFALSPLADKFLRAIGLLPAFRMNWEGEQALASNGATFNDSEKSLLDGNTVVIYPEAGHQDRHWLGTFSYGYTRMAFEAAEMGGFDKEIFILPACNHYSEYFTLRGEMLVRYGTPISLKPYYELYKTKPRTAQRQVNALVREQIHDMMLSIDDTENYDAIDYIRRSAYGCRYATSCGLDPDELPQKLEADKRLVAALAEAKAAEPERTQELYKETVALSEAIQAEGLTDNLVEKGQNITGIVVQAAVLVILLPLAVFALWPSAVCWFVPKYFWDKVGDKMLRGSFLIALNVLFILPVLGLITFVAAWVRASLVAALIYVAAFPLICLFEWKYYRWCMELVAMVKTWQASKSGVLQSLRTRRTALFAGLDKLLGKG